MTDAEEFASLITRARARDERASAEIVARFKPTLLRQISGHIAKRNMAHRIDADDVCQTVLANFFTRLSYGQFAFDEPDALARLLARMGHNQVLDEVRRQLTARRKAARKAADSATPLSQLPAKTGTPSRIASGNELMTEIYRRLSEEERVLADRRSRGQDWAAIAAEVGGTPEGVRKKLTRAYERVMHQLGLD